MRQSSSFSSQLSILSRCSSYLFCFSILFLSISSLFSQNYDDQASSLSSNNNGFVMAESTISSTTTKAKNAYVSVLYHEEFMMGIRVLGSSLKRSQTPHDKYLLVTPNVPVSVVRVLEAEGWIVRQVQAIANPHGNHRLFLQRLNFVFTKLNIYRLTEYEKVVILDADTMLISNVDELFACNDLCAVVRNGFFNAGVMVIRPSESLYKELTDLYQVLPSYNGGEQGFLNQWFSNFSFCPYFDEARLIQRQQDPAEMDALANLDREHLTFKEAERCGRLSTQYNGDVGLYYTNDASWFVRGAYSEPKIIHFTFGEMKPWHWYSYSLFHLNWIWFEEYRQLEPIAESHFQHYLLLYVNTIIFCLLALWYNVLYVKQPGSSPSGTASSTPSTPPTPSSPSSPSSQDDTHPQRFLLSLVLSHKAHNFLYSRWCPSWFRDLTMLHLIFSLFGYGAVVASVLICLRIIPKQFYDHPYTNFVAFIELVHAIFFTFMGSLYYLVYRYATIYNAPLGVSVGSVSPVSSSSTSSSTSSSSSSSSTTLSSSSSTTSSGLPQPPIRESVFYAFFWLVFLCSCLAFFLENEALNAQPKKKIWSMIACAIFAFVFVTTAFFRLPYIWYRYGSQPSSAYSEK